MEIIAALIGAGVVAVSPLVPALRPVAKTAVKSGLAVAAAAKGAAVVAGQQWSELVAEAEAGRQAGHKAPKFDEADDTKTHQPVVAEPAMTGEGQTVETRPVTKDTDVAQTTAETMGTASLSTALFPAAKAAVKGGLALTQAARDATAATAQQWSAVVAEAEADRQASYEASLAESIAVVDSAAAPPTAESGIAPEPADPAAGSGERPFNDTSGISPAVRAGTETVTTTTRDDLKQINGIGPKVAELLSSAGVKTFEQVATADVAQLRQVLDRAGSRYRIIDPTSWPAQARSLMELDQ